MATDDKDAPWPHDETRQRLQQLELARNHLSEAEKALNAGVAGEMTPDEADAYAREHVEKARRVLEAPTRMQADEAAADGDESLADVWGATFVQAYSGDDA